MSPSPTYAASRAVAVVSESFAKRMWPNDERDRQAVQIRDSRPRTVVGVVGDIRVRGLERESEPQVYLPAATDAGRRVLWVSAEGSRRAGDGRRPRRSCRRSAASSAASTRSSRSRTCGRWRRSSPSETASRMTQLRRARGPVRDRVADRGRRHSRAARVRGIAALARARREARVRRAGGEHRATRAARGDDAGDDGRRRRRRSSPISPRAQWERCSRAFSRAIRRRSRGRRRYASLTAIAGCLRPARRARESTRSRCFAATEKGDRN